MLDPTVIRDPRQATQDRSMRVLELAISIGTLVFAVALTAFRA